MRAEISFKMRVVSPSETIWSSSYELFCVGSKKYLVPEPFLASPGRNLDACRSQIWAKDRVTGSAENLKFFKVVKNGRRRSNSSFLEREIVQARGGKGVVARGGRARARGGTRQNDSLSIYQVRLNPFWRVLGAYSLTF